MSGNIADPKDWSDWEKFRDQVVHPAATIKPMDLERARENIQRHDWAQRYADSLRESADDIAQQISPDYLENMIEPTTPGGFGPCPACRAKGLPWHPNGQWTWSPSDPNALRCEVCDTVFPDAEFPEDIAIVCTWGKGQTFTFVGGDTFKCFSYHEARPSISGITRVRKVSHVTGQLQTLATAYALTEDLRYVHAAKAILLRFSDVFPEYLVRAGYGYGEYAGMDPHIAAEHINDLPEDELVYPPNKPDRKIFAGYWAASRIGSSGMDGGWVVRVADAYSLTCTAQENGTPIYNKDERIRIEHDLLLESTYLAACDTAINNKSVGNRAGAAIAGMCVGHPGLVHFGLDGFVKTVNDWFLPDGGTSESPAYAMMTMSGIRPFALAFRGYSDPSGYTRPNGSRLDDFNACRDTLYGDCWQALVWTLQGDLHFPPSADSYRSTTIGVPFADLLALAYPTDAHVALLKECIDKDPSGGTHQNAIFYRDPDLGGQSAPPLELPDVVFPYLSQGYLRTGEGGRESVVTLNAADHANHHHIDGLSLYYWKDGHELLSDLGYLWDHPDKYQTARTCAHNLVVIDGKDQTGRGRQGNFHLFSVTPTVKVMEASSDGYGQDSIYQRTILQIDHDPAGTYLLDIFRVSKGQTADYIFHGPHDNYSVKGIDLEESQPVAFGENGIELSNLQKGREADPWRIVWTFDDGYTFEAFAPGSVDESVYVGDGWGQRDHRNTDVGATLPYVVRHLEGDEKNDVFVAAFAGSRGDESLLKSIHILPLPESAPNDAVAIAVQTVHGIDIIISMMDPAEITVPTDIGDVSTDGRVTAVLTGDESPSSACLIGGTSLSMPGLDLTAPSAILSGSILSIGASNGNSYFDIDCEMSEIQTLEGQTLFAIDDDTRHGYAIRKIESIDAGCRVFTKCGHCGFEARSAKRWELPVTVCS
ncbi:MAG: heparinase II/III family protein [Candidatus Latescibacteria bacterium]|nr:heparinase II/III family protein [Candidatus Latescibacterota bacterium]